MYNVIATKINKLDLLLNINPAGVEKLIEIQNGHKLHKM